MHKRQLAQLRTLVDALVGNEDDTPLLFSEVISRFRLHEMPERYSTYSAYDSMLRRWIEPHWSDVPLHKIKAADVETWLKGMDAAPKTRQHRKALMHSLFECAMRWELTDTNPVSLARVKGGSKRLRRPHVLTPQQFHRVLACLKAPYRQMALIAGLTGLRASEIVALQWCDIDFEQRTLRIQRASVCGRVSTCKTESSEDLLPMDEQLVDELLAWREQSRPAPWMFPNAEGRPYHQDSIRARHLIRAGRAAGLVQRLGWHTFRHSYRRWLDESGAPVGLIKELMRHAHIATTMDVYGVGTLTPAKREAHSAMCEKVGKSGEFCAA